MKLRPCSFVLAAILSTAAPSFADRISSGFADGLERPFSPQESRNTNDFRDHHLSRNMGGNLPMESANLVRADGWSDRSNDGKSSIAGYRGALEPLWNSPWGSNAAQESWFVRDLGREGFFGWDDEKSSRKHKAREWRDADGSVSVLATPEPSSGMLLFFGLAALGLIVYRRNAL